MIVLSTISDRVLNGQIKATKEKLKDKSIEKKTREMMEAYLLSLKEEAKKRSF